MRSKISSYNMELTQLYKAEDELYHRYGMSCGLSDPAIWVLYSLYEDEERVCTQNDLVTTWFYPKQTINYTVSTLVKNGLVRLEQLRGARNSKAILLTEEGRSLCAEKIQPLINAEEASLSCLTEEERELLMKLTQKKFECLEHEIEKIIL